MIQTAGCHHIGLTVRDLEASERFFCQYLGWQRVRKDDVYPAVFVSDGVTMVTLWQAKKDIQDADYKRVIGLHHVAFKVLDEAALNEVFQQLSRAEDVQIEFAPELLRQGPAKHMMCYEPNGIRIEFIWPGV